MLHMVVYNIYNLGAEKLWILQNIKEKTKYSETPSKPHSVYTGIPSFGNMACGP